MQKPPEDGQSLDHDVVRRLTAQIGDEADAAGVMLVAEMVQPFVLWQRQAALSVFQILFHVR
jgi:hypothetical protein